MLTFSFFIWVWRYISLSGHVIINISKLWTSLDVIVGQFNIDIGVSSVSAWYKYGISSVHRQNVRTELDARIISVFESDENEIDAMPVPILVWLFPSITWRSVINNPLL